MDEHYSMERHRLLASAGLGGGYPSLESAVAAHAAHLRALSAAAYPDLSRSSNSAVSPASVNGVLTGSTSAASTVNNSGGMVSSPSIGLGTPMMTSSQAESAYHAGRYMPGALSIGTGLPFLSSVFASSLTPSSPYRSTAGGLVNMRPFWPPTPPPDAYSRCGLSSGYYPLFSPTVPSSESSHLSSQNAIIPRITPSHPYTHIFESHKDVPFLSPTLHLNHSPMAPPSPLAPPHSPMSSSHSMTHPTVPPSHFLQYPGLIDRHPSYGHCQPGLGVYEDMELLPSKSSRSPAAEKVSVKNQHLPVRPLSVQEHSPGLCCSPDSNNHRTHRVKDTPKVATVKVYKHRTEESKSLNRTQSKEPLYTSCCSNFSTSPSLSSISSNTICSVTPSNISATIEHSSSITKHQGEKKSLTLHAEVKSPLGSEFNHNTSITTSTMSTSTVTTKTTSVNYSKESKEGSLEIPSNKNVIPNENSSSDSKHQLTSEPGYPPSSNSSSFSTSAPPCTFSSWVHHQMTVTSVIKSSCIQPLEDKGELCLLSESKEKVEETHLEVTLAKNPILVETRNNETVEKTETEAAVNLSIRNKDASAGNFDPWEQSLRRNALNRTKSTEKVNECHKQMTPPLDLPILKQNNVNSEEKKELPQVLLHLTRTQSETKDMVQEETSKTENKNVVSTPVTEPVTKLNTETVEPHPNEPVKQETVVKVIPAPLKEAPKKKSLTVALKSNPDTLVTAEQSCAINLSTVKDSVPQKPLPCSTPTNPSPTRVSPRAALPAETPLVPKVVTSPVKTSHQTNNSDNNSLVALSRLATSAPAKTKDASSRITGSEGSWSRNKSHKVKPRSMVSSIQSETIKQIKPAENDAVNSTRLKILPSSPNCNQARPFYREPLKTQFRETSKMHSTHSEQRSNTVLAMQETVSQTMVSVTSSVLPGSGNSSIPVGIAVAQLRQDSSNITLKRNTTGSENVLANCPSIITDKRETNIQKNTTSRVNEANILVSQVQCNSAIGSTHWETQDILNRNNTSLPTTTWLNPTPVVASAPMVTPAVWVGQAPTFTATQTAPTLPMDNSQMPLPPVGYQLARDPMSGQIFLLPASNIEIVDRSNVWPTYNSGTVQQIVAQPTAFQQVIQQMTSVAKPDLKTCLTPMPKKPFLGGTMQMTSHLETSHDTKELKMIGHPGSVQSTMAGITVQSSQPFTFPGFTASAAPTVPATLSYFYEPPTILHLSSQTQSTNTMQPATLQAEHLQHSVLQSSAIQVTGLPNGLSTGLHMSISPANLHPNESCKRSQATSPLTMSTSPMQQHECEEGDSGDESSQDDELPVKGVTLAIQVDMDASTNDNDYEDHPIMVEVQDSANQTDGLFYENPKDETEDEGSRPGPTVSYQSQNSSSSFVYSSSVAAARNPEDFKSVGCETVCGSFCEAKDPPLPFTVPNTVTCESRSESQPTQKVQTDKVETSEASEIDQRFPTCLSQNWFKSSTTDQKVPFYSEAFTPDVVSESDSEASSSIGELRVIVDLPEDSPSCKPVVKKQEEKANNDSSPVEEFEEESVALLPTNSNVVLDFIDHHGLNLLVDSIEEFAHQKEKEATTQPDRKGTQINSSFERKEIKPVNVIRPMSNIASYSNEGDDEANADRWQEFLKSSKTQEEEIKGVEIEKPIYMNNLDSSCSDGLGLLCALAEQRFLEEKQRTVAQKNQESLSEKQPLKRVPIHKSYDTDLNPNYPDSSDYFNENQSLVGKTGYTPSKCSRGPSLTMEDSMDPNEIEMRFKLAELQRKYKIKQKELAKLKPRKEESDSDSKRNKSKKRHFALFHSTSGGNTSDSHSASDFSPPPVVRVPLLGLPKTKPTKTEKQSLAAPLAVATLPASNPSSFTKMVVASEGSPSKKSMSSSSKKSKSETKKQNSSKKSSKLTNSSKEDKSLKMEVSKKNGIKPAKLVISTSSKDDSKIKTSESTVKPLQITSPRTSSDSEGERLFVEFWRNQRAEMLLKSSENKLNESPAKTTKSSEISEEKSLPVVTSQSVEKKSTSEDPNGALGMLADCASFFKDENTKRKRKGYDSSDSEESLPLVKKFKSRKKDEDSQLSWCSDQRSANESKKKTKLETKNETKSKTKRAYTVSNSSGVASVTGDDVWNRRRSERIFFHDAGVTLPSTFTLVDEQSNCSIGNEVLITDHQDLVEQKAVKPLVKEVQENKKVKNENYETESKVQKISGPKVTEEKIKKKQKMKKETNPISKKIKIKDLKKQKDKSVPDELFAALRQCRLSECNLAANVGGLSPAIDVEESNSSQGDVPLSLLAEKSNANQTVPELPSCVLTPGNLENNIRVLTKEDGLFYAGYIKAIQAPDIYGIVLDGERGNRPHIYSREEILNVAIMEMKPSHPLQIPEGSRVCAYWSQQYRCLYPGTVAKVFTATTPNPNLEKDMVYVEFDDGDSGRIPLEDVRQLPQDIPVLPMERDPLLVLSKRGTQTGTENTIIQAIAAFERAEGNAEKLKASTKKITKQIPKKALKRTIDSVLSNESDSSASVVKSKLKKTSKVVPSNPKTEEGGASSSCSPANSSPTDESSNSVISASSSVRIKKHKKHKIDHKHRHHHHRHHCHRSHHHKKHKHNRKGSGSSSEHGSQKMSENEKVSSEKKLKEVSPNKVVEIKTKEQKSELTVKIKTPCLVSKEAKSGEENLVETKVSKKKKDNAKHNSSVEKSKIAAFLPARQLWRWSGKSFKKQKTKGKGKKEYFKAITRGKEMIKVGDCAVFLSTGRPHLPYVGRIDTMWQSWGGNMVVKVVWFYHPEETKGGQKLAHPKGALYESPHVDENDVQTISHKCEVLSWKDYKKWKEENLSTKKYTFENEDIYYLAGTYDPLAKVLTLASGVL